MKTPTIPMHPSQLPQQRLRLVHDMPPEDPALDVAVSDVWPDGPKRIGRTARKVCQVEWAWSPMHSRIDAYVLSHDRRHWFLWKQWFDDDEDRWATRLAARCRRGGLSAEDAAMILLAALLDELRRDEHLDHFHWINNTGLLDVGQIDAVARHVWGA